MLELNQASPKLWQTSDARLFFQIADLTILIECGDPALRLSLDSATAEFLVAETVADIKIKVARATAAQFILPAPERLLFDSGALWRLYRADNGYQFYFSSPRWGQLPYRIARFNQDFSQGTILMRDDLCESEWNPLEYPLPELLINNLLPLRQGAELHACGVVDRDGQGYLFIGHSEAGKTTTARLWLQEAGITVLSDDRVIVRQVGERFYLYGTPWHGEAELASPRRQPLSRIFYLQHGKQNQLVELSGSEAISRLFACSFPAFYQPAGVAATLEFYQKLIDLVPCQELRFLPDRTVIDFVRGL